MLDCQTVPKLIFNTQWNYNNPRKNDRLAWDGSIKLNWDSKPIKDATDTDNEPTINYGTAWSRHLEQIWNLRISYPSSEILLWDDDITGAFKHCKFNPEVIGAFGYVLLQMLIIPCGLQFGCTFSPANFVPLADAREQLAESLSRDTELLLIHKEYLDLVQFSPDPDESVSFIQATSCATHQGVFHTDGSRKNTKHNTFVDDNLMAETKNFMPQAMAASIEALFRLLGRPDIQYRKADL